MWDFVLSTNTSDPAPTSESIRGDFFCMLILLRATLKIKCKWQLSLKVWLQDSHFTPLHSVQNTKANTLGLLCLCFGFVEVTASDEDSLILQTLWAPVLTVHYLLFIHRGCACQYHPGMKALIFFPPVSWWCKVTSNILWGSHYLASIPAL